MFKPRISQGDAAVLRWLIDSWAELSKHLQKRIESLVTAEVGAADRAVVSIGRSGDRLS
jgi:hypothetical protein